MNTCIGKRPDSETHVDGLCLNRKECGMRNGRTSEMGLEALRRSSQAWRPDFGRCLSWRFQDELRAEMDVTKKNVISECLRNIKGNLLGWEVRVGETNDLVEILFVHFT